MSDVICEQAAVGSVAKVVAADSEEPAQPEDVLGFLTAVNLRTNREASFATVYEEARRGAAGRDVGTNSKKKVKKVYASLASLAIKVSTSLDILAQATEGVRG